MIAAVLLILLFSAQHGKPDAASAGADMESVSVASGQAVSGSSAGEEVLAASDSTVSTISDSSLEKEMETDAEARHDPKIVEELEKEASGSDITEEDASAEAEKNGVCRGEKMSEEEKDALAEKVQQAIANQDKQDREETDKLKDATSEQSKDGESWYLASDDTDILNSEAYMIVQSQCTWTGSVIDSSRGVNYGPHGKETYYNLPMDGVVEIMRGLGYDDPYWVRPDGVKMFGNYVMIAADLSVYPRGSIVECSEGMAMVCDTGAFVLTPEGKRWFDIAVDW